MKTATAVRFIHAEAPDRAKFQPVRNIAWVKPEGGLWASPADSTYGWREWCASEDYGDPDAVEHVLTLRSDLRLAVIDSHDDLLDLLALYPSQDIIGSPVLDFEAMARDYDGLWLTVEGQWRTRMTTPGLYGWDCESILFFTWPLEG